MIDILYLVNGYNRPSWTGTMPLPVEIGDMYELKKEYRVKQIKEDVERRKIRVNGYKDSISELTSQIKKEEVEIKDIEKKLAELEKND